MRVVRVLKTLGALAIGLAAVSCASTAENLCALECECEHCNDYTEEGLCISAQLRQDQAEVYECDAAYDAWAICIEEKGVCDEKEAQFSTRSKGSCSEFQQTGQMCMTDNDCNGFNASCVNGNCSEKVCAGNNDPCQDDFDCQGEDLCDNAEQALNECIANASDKPVAFIDFN